MPDSDWQLGQGTVDFRNEERLAASRGDTPAPVRVPRATVYYACMRCQGTGREDESACPDCEGLGAIAVATTPTREATCTLCETHATHEIVGASEVAGWQVLLCLACGNKDDYPPPAMRTWAGVYPSHCIDPSLCEGLSHCPRERSCVD